MYFFDHEKEVTVRNRYRYGHPWLPVDLLESTSTIDLTRVGINYHHDLLLVRVGFIIKFLSIVRRAAVASARGALRRRVRV